VDLGSGFGSIGYKIEGLMPGTVYYFRAYATNVVGTTYGGNLVARTFDGYTTDYEGHIYSTVRLGKQEWMNRNLETRYFSNGDWIGTTGTPTLNTEQEGKPLYQWAFNYHEGFIPGILPPTAERFVRLDGIFLQSLSGMNSWSIWVGMH
jgi:hypothetical protein